MDEKRNRLWQAGRILGWGCVAIFVALSVPPPAFTALSAATAGVALSLVVGLVATYFALRHRTPRR